MTRPLRLEHHGSQTVFRCLLEALAHPGRPTSLPVDAAPDAPPALLPALALSDVDVTVAVLDDEDDAGHWSEVVRTATGARAAASDASDIVVALRPPRPEEIAALRRGDSLHPELGARLVVACQTIASGAADIAKSATGAAPEARVEGDVSLSVSGPGVRDPRTIVVKGLAAETFEAVLAANGSFPAGIDTWLVAADRTVVGLPRSTRLEPGSAGGTTGTEGDS